MTASEAGVVVPVKRSVTLRQTVGYVIQRALDRLADGEEPVVHFVVIASWRADDPGSTADRRQADDLLEQVETWAQFDLDESDVDPDSITIETAVIGDDDYHFSPTDYADLLAEYAVSHGITNVVVDPEYSLVGHTTLLQPFEFELQQRDLAVEEAPVDRPTRRGQLVRRDSPARFLALFGGSFLFYQILGGFSGLFDIVTGLATALVVAVALDNVSFYRDPTLTESPKRLARGLIYAPYLLYEILVSNLVVARVILDPRSKIDPRLTRVRFFVGSGLPLTTLANSITLTPGTLTVKADNQQLYVHSLVPFARDGLFDGALERWVRFVFYGREAARFPSPRDRGDTEILQDPDADEPTTNGPETVADGGVDPNPADSQEADQ
ncbi:monovalent cation/H+ antiporter subunit E [Halonotius terrestris]|uniref:Monovalent cation/H+ antiporter subunit E n=1 Tax=Halonotius terrestris TaxID=2487750 RepID=A0A8J8TBF1_9EURY|nr:monovalent cation/H+ antiporter subunit E [Halonotius terrestris]TQQ80842.1 monovalent cation/H+ antiporter subunit E [Halonotius terrestris]